jgi:hypothetical protein
LIFMALREMSWSYRSSFNESAISFALLRSSLEVRATLLETVSSSYPFEARAVTAP